MASEYKQSNYMLGGAIDGMCNSFTGSKRREDCKYYQEEKHMGATIPCCVKNSGLGNCPCEDCNEFKKR